MATHAMLRSLALALLLEQARSLHARSQPDPSSTAAQPPFLVSGGPYDFDDLRRDEITVGAERSLIAKPGAEKHFFSEEDCASGMFVSREACRKSREKPVYLASYPCSGNTWARSMIEGISGIYSGSVYNDTTLREAGFLGEGSADPGRVFPIKTHWPVIGNHTEDVGLRHLVIARDPLHAALSWCNLPDLGLGEENHHLEMPQAELEAIFNTRIEYNLREWADMAYTFMHRSDVHVVRYEDIVRNTSHVYRTDILPYLGVDPDHPDVVERLQSTLEQSNSAYETTRRKHTYTFKFMDNHTQLAREIIGDALANYYGYCFEGGAPCHGQH